MNKNANRACTDLTGAISLRAPLPLEYKFPVTAAVKNAIPTDKQITSYIQPSAMTLMGAWPTPLGFVSVVSTIDSASVRIYHSGR
jgi:hypothetical protein